MSQERHQPIEKRFAFEASAVAFAAHIRRPNDHLVRSVASSVIPVTGGTAEASAGELNDDSIFYYSSASTSVVGDFADKRRAMDFTHGNHHENELATQTFVSTTLSGLKITIPQEDVAGATPTVRTISVETLYTRLGSAAERGKQNAFPAMEAQIAGVRIDGHELLVTVAPEMFARYETYDKLIEGYERDSDFRKEFGHCFYPTGDERSGLSALLHKPSIANESKVIVATVVKEIRWAKDGDAARNTTIVGNRLAVEGLGTVYFGETIIEEKSRRLTLLRFELGSPKGGSGVGCDAHVGGQGVPPPK